MQPILSVRDLGKTYAGGVVALSHIDLDIEPGEIFALLGPNGAGKTTLINIVCGMVNPTSGTALVKGHDVVREYRETRSIIGLVPQELPVETFESVWKTANFSRGKIIASATFRLVVANRWPGQRRGPALKGRYS